MINPPNIKPEPPAIVRRLAGTETVKLIWLNQTGGTTWGWADRYLKWSPHSAGIDLERERVRLNWLAGRHPVPRVLDYGADAEAQWTLTAALPGGHAVGDPWRERSAEAIAAIAEGLRRLHAIPINDVPPEWAAASWVRRVPPQLGPRPPLEDPVLVHGDACAPNALIDLGGQWTGHVDLGDLAVGDRWADLAVASMSLDWNFGEGHQNEFFAAYGIAPDADRIRYYRALWHAES